MAHELRLCKSVIFLYVKHASYDLSKWWNGDKPTINADSFNTVIFFFCFFFGFFAFFFTLNVSLQNASHKSSHDDLLWSSCSSRPSAVVAWKRSRSMLGGLRVLAGPLIAPRSPVWPLEGSWRRGWGWSPTWGKLTWSQGPGLSELRSGYPCAAPSSWAQGCSDATVLKVQQTASITTWSGTLKNVVEQSWYTAIEDINHRYQVCRCRIRPQPHFLLKPCTSLRRLSLLDG